MSRMELRLFRRRHGELGTVADALGPALHDGLLFGIETDALFTVGMHVAEQAPLPPAETVPGHWDRDGPVDANHAPLEGAAEFTSHMTVSGKAGHAVAEFVGIDHAHGLRKIAYP